VTLPLQALCVLAHTHRACNKCVTARGGRGGERYVRVMRRRFQHPGTTYHAHTVSAGSIPLVENDEDCELWRTALGIVVERYGLRVFAWALLTTHWHVLLQTPEANVGEAMRWLNGVYAQGFNRRHGRRGHLFGGRYDAWVVQSDDHFLNVARYIAWNPVLAGLADHPARYRWSSYGATIRGGRTWPANAADELLERAGGFEAYRAFVEAGRVDSSHPHDVFVPGSVRVS
jgi:putative transposase